MPEWFTYRFFIDDRIYYVVPYHGRFVTGWLRTDGEQCGGHWSVIKRWKGSCDTAEGQTHPDTETRNN